MIPSTVSRYTNFLNEILTTINRTGSVTNITALTRERGLDTHLFAQLTHSGTFYSPGKIGHFPQFVTDRTNPFTDAEVTTILADMKKRKLESRSVSITDEPHGVDSENPLAKFTTKELIAELHRRGYTGTISIRREIKF